MRKSREKRIADTEATLEAYRAAGLGDDRRVRFMSDMLYRLGRGKGLTKKQRSWLDSLCEEGVPAPKGDVKLIARIDACLEHATEKGAEVLKDFRGKLVRGWDLSPKQVAFMERLLVEAEDIRDNGPYVPEPALLEEALFAARLIDSRGDQYKFSHPGMTKASARVLRYEADPESVRITKGDLEWLIRKVGKSSMEQFSSPKFEEGTMVWVARKGCWSKISNRWLDGGYAMALVVGAPTPHDGKVCYPVLVDGELKTLRGEVIKKRRPKNWQAEVETEDAAA